ncbi:uncharacterized protein [Euphorbia lathyris]|uniref:uncharacterized protein n=1 Tax=Euphorbia lathyris TaxID=212925 RepID=UPI0033132733
MAVHRDGLIDEEENVEDNALFEEPMIDLDPDTPPHLRELGAACQVGNVEALRIAIENLNGSVNEAVEDGDTALHLVCLYGYLPCAQLLIERGANVEAKDEDGAIPLHDACAGGYTEVARLLLNSATDAECVKRMVETVDAEGDTPLHHAARGEHVGVIRLLLAFGAPATKPNVYEKTPGELAEPGTEARRILESAVSALSCH